MTKFLNTVEKYLLYLTLAIFPIFVVLNSTAPTLISKTELLFVSGSILVILWVIRMLLRGSITFAFGKFDVGIVLLILAYLVSAVFKTPNKMEAFLIPGAATLVVVSGLFYFLANQLDKKSKEGIALAFVVSGILLALCLMFAGLGIFAKIGELPAPLKDPLFNPMGGVIPAGIYLTPAIVVGISLILKEKDLIKKIFWGVSSAVMVMALVLLVNSALPGKNQFPKFPSLDTSWQVAVQSLAKSPIFGFGPGNYLTAFNEFRPISYNQTDLWQVRFTTASNFYLTLITETGLLGLAAILILLFSIFNFLKSNLNFTSLSLIASLVLFALFPVSPVLLIPLFILLTVSSRSEDNISSLKTSRIPRLILGLLILAGVVAADFFGAKIVLAEATFTKSLLALAANDAKGTYSLMQSAVSQNPKVDRYHTAIAQIDMALAQSLSNKKNLTEDDKKTITQLVQQSINEAKAGVALNPARAGNWEVLAQIYRGIMPFAQGADNFAIQTYLQAISLDPINPNLRIALGGVYYALGRYDDAIDTFKLAVLAKSDLANAHYNLAIAYREKKNFDAAIAEMNTVLTLVKKDSQDYTLAKNTLDDLEKNRPAGSSENLTAPQKNQTSNIKPPITLPQEATPPATGQ